MANNDEPDIDSSDSPKPGDGRPFVPRGFQPPPTPRTPDFWLEPLGAQHNVADYEAWSSSIEHIRGTPGFPYEEWPMPLTLNQNLADLHMHARHFENQQGFTYTVRSSQDDDVIGCVYIYPSENDAIDDDASVDATVRSWVRASHAELDLALYTVVSDWLTKSWPFDSVDYAARQ